MSRKADTGPIDLAGPRVVPFTRPTSSPRASGYLMEALGSDHHQGDGPFTQRCRALLQEVLGAPAVLLTTSGTHALDFAALLLDIGPGDEVIVPSFTFSSTANAFVLRGAHIVFADIRRDTFNIDESRLPELITPRTRAVVPVHYGGIACAMDEITRVSAAAGVTVVEDNAHGLLGTYEGRQLGTFGALAAQSFHATKNFSAGEGGALVINNSELVERAEIIREKGTDRGRFIRGEIDKYTWVDVGSSYLPSDLLAALLLAQLEDRTEVQRKRAAIWQRYQEGLAGWAAEVGVQLPVVPSGCQPAFHLFSLLMPTPAARDEMIGWLKSRGISSPFHYIPLHTSPMGQRLGADPAGCPVTSDVSSRLLRLPFYTDLTTGDQDYVVDAVCAGDVSQHG